MIDRLLKEVTLTGSCSILVTVESAHEPILGWLITLVVAFILGLGGQLAFFGGGYRFLVLRPWLSRRQLRLTFLRR